MLRISKISEYGVLALGFIGGKQTPQSARDVSMGLDIPYEITAKTLQRLKEAGLLESTKGVNGGYKLLDSLAAIKFSQVIDAIEGPVAVVDCEDHSKECRRTGSCEIKFGMQKLNQRVRGLLESVSLDELVSRQNIEYQKVE